MEWAWLRLRYWRNTTARSLDSSTTRAGREEGQGSREFRRFHGEFDATVRTAFSGKVEGLPLGNPISAFSLTVVFQLHGHRIQSGFEDFGALIELKLCEALFQNRLNMVNGMAFKRFNTMA